MGNKSTPFAICFVRHCKYPDRYFKGTYANPKWTTNLKAARSWTKLGQGRGMVTRIANATGIIHTLLKFEVTPEMLVAENQIDRVQTAMNRKEKKELQYEADRKKREYERAQRDYANAKKKIKQYEARY